MDWCKNCLNVSTRPRITFDKRGWCNACQWVEEKKTLDWEAREKELAELLDKYRGKYFDCIVPVSGGKDGSYIAHQLRHKYKQNVLTVTVTPAMALELGNENLRRFIGAGYNHIQISPDVETMRLLNRRGFIEKGFPYYGWLTAIQTAVIRTALNMDIPLIFYGEDGEVEYGGTDETKNTAVCDLEYMENIYLEGGHGDILRGLNDAQKYFYTFPDGKKRLAVTHWSYFEAWDPYRNYRVAKENYGLQEADGPNSGTFTDYAQNDQALYALHTYIMYLKYGFGRATQDAGIEIRRGSMSRSEAVELVNKYDGQLPDPEMYLEYYRMSRDEFDAVLDKWANKDLFEKIDGEWCPKFTIQ